MNNSTIEFIRELQTRKNNVYDREVELLIDVLLDYQIKQYAKDFIFDAIAVDFNGNLSTDNDLLIEELVSQLKNTFGIEMSYSQLLTLVCETKQNIETIQNLSR